MDPLDLPLTTETEEALIERVVPWLQHALTQPPDRTTQLLYRLDLPEAVALPLLAEALRPTTQPPNDTDRSNHHASPPATTPDDSDSTALRTLARLIVRTLKQRAERREALNEALGGTRDLDGEVP